MNYEIKDGFLHVWFSLKKLPRGVASQIAPMYVTPREAQVLAAVNTGLGNKEIASLIHVSERTVKAHVGALLAKAKVPSRRELANFAPKVKQYSKVIDLEQTIARIQKARPLPHESRRVRGAELIQ